MIFKLMVFTFRIAVAVASLSVGATLTWYFMPSFWSPSMKFGAIPFLVGFALIVFGLYWIQETIIGRNKRPQMVVEVEREEKKRLKAIPKVSQADIQYIVDNLPDEHSQRFIKELTDISRIKGSIEINKALYDWYQRASELIGKK